jgi:ribosomal protein L37AE/L43A
MSRITCAQCGAAIIAADWAEWVSERCVRNVWCCDECGYEFETRAYLAGPVSGADREVGEFVHRQALAA